MRKSILATLIVSLFLIIPTLGHADSVKIGDSEESFYQFASRLIFSENRAVFNIERPTNLGIIEISTDLWKFEIRSDVPARKRLGKKIPDWRKPYELDIFLGRVHHPSVTKTKPGIMPTAQFPPKEVTADMKSEKRVTIGSVTIRASLYFKTKEALFKFLMEEFYPFIDKKIVISGVIIPGGLNLGREKHTTPLDLKIRIPIAVLKINGKAYR